MKVCAHCLRGLPVEAFAASVTASDGLQSWCRHCKRGAARQHYHANLELEREHVRLRARARRTADPDGDREYQRGWRISNRDHVRAYNARRRKLAATKAWAAAYWKRWRAANLAKARAYARKGEAVRRARVNAALVERVDPSVVFERDRGICGICLLPVDPNNWHLDHIEPIALGGEHSYANVRVTHPACNRARSRATRDAKARKAVPA